LSNARGESNSGFVYAVDLDIIRLIGRTKGEFYEG